MLEEGKETIDQQRERHRKLEKTIEMGQCKIQTIKVRNAEDELRDVDVHAIGSGQLEDCLSAEGMTWEEFSEVIDPIKVKKNRELQLKKMVKMKIHRSISALAISTQNEIWTYDDISRELNMLAPIAISMTCLSMMGLLGKPTKEQLQFFRKT